MSGSYQQLLQKYNQLLALVLNISGGTLQSVITANDELQSVAPNTGDTIVYDGTNVVWAQPTSDTLQSVITANDELQSVAPNTGDTIVYDGTNVVWAQPTSDTLQSVITANDELQSVAPTLNQVIKYDGTNVVWSTETQDLDQVLTVGNTTTQSAEFQVGTSTTTIEGNKIEMTSTVSGIVRALVLDNVIDSVPFIQLSTIDIATTNTNASILKNDSLSFISGIGPSFAITGISVLGTGLSIDTNGTLKLTGLTGFDGQFLKYNYLGNAVWEDIPQPSIIHDTATIAPGTTTGTITFPTILASAPTVTISQLEFGGSIVGLAVTGITTTDFTWKSTAPNFGKILWIAI